MGLRAQPLLTLAGLVAACHGAPRNSFVGAPVLAPASEAEVAHDELLHADLARADSVALRGFGAGLASTFTEDVIYLRGGLPILRGSAAARAVASAEPVGPGVGVRWQPVRADVSLDRKSGYSYGYAIFAVAQDGAPSVHVDRYIAFWRREPAGWRISGYAETYASPPSTLTLPAGAGDGVLADVPMSPRRGALDAIRIADAEFSREASRVGTGDAFGRFAASDAQIFSSAGEFITGPRAISGSFGPATGRSSLVWHPVEGEMASSGDLGFTVGNAVFSDLRDDGTAAARYSKYFTVWKKQKDGSWRYVVDGGSARPP